MEFRIKCHLGYEISGPASFSFNIALSPPFAPWICKAMIVPSLKTLAPPVSFKSLPAIAALLLTGVALQAEPADQRIAMGDVFSAKLQAAEALKFYLPAEKLEPNNVRLLEHISREYRHLMSDTTSAQEKFRLGSTAVDYARRAVALDPNDAEAQLAVAISYGRLEPLESNREKFARCILV